MRRGNIVEGIAAGLKSYMGTKQWMSQMEQNKAQLEAMKLANRMNEMKMPLVEQKVRLATDPEYARQVAIQNALNELAAKKATFEDELKMTEELMRRKNASEEQILAKKMQMIEDFYNRTGIVPSGYTIPRTTTGKTYTPEQARKFVDEQIMKYGQDRAFVPPNWYQAAIDATAQGDEGKAVAIIDTWNTITSDSKYNWLADLPQDRRHEFISDMITMNYYGIPKEQIDSKMEQKRKELFGEPEGGGWLNYFYQYIYPSMPFPGAGYGGGKGGINPFAVMSNWIYQGQKTPQFLPWYIRGGKE